MTMKGMFDSEEPFMAHATIAAGNYMLRQIMNDEPDRSPLVKQIDVTTGFDKVLAKQLARKVLPIMEEIIEAKKAIDADCTEDEKILARIKKEIGD